MKNTELKNEIKRLSEDKYKQAEECSQLKVKLLQALQLNKTSREENEKSGKMLKKLFERLDELEKKEEERRQFEEMMAQIE